MRRRLAIVLISLAASAGTVLGDGGMFFRRASYKAADVFQPTQKVYIRWDGSQEKLLIQTKYEGPAEEMVWIVPVPSEPDVQTGDEGVFEKLSEKTSWPDIACSDFPWPESFDVDPPIWTQVSFGGGSPSVVQWRRKIGDYDVVLLRPVGGQDVIAWLNANDFAIPAAIHPVLEDYVREGWWMVVSRIHPDAMTDITREKLAKGTLHPLELTFPSTDCVYPMRLTSMAAGPVEELIYIEGATHFEPRTLSGGDWRIDLFGGPLHQVPQHYYQSDVDQAIASREGRTKTRHVPHLTKLRRVFQPDEMTRDLVFAPMDYSKWLDSNDPLLIGQAATHYGRRRDPNGVPHLLKALSSGILKQVEPSASDYQKDWASPASRILKSLDEWSGYWVINSGTPAEYYSPVADHVFSCIWALGEIAVEHPIGDRAEELLLQCALHDNQLVRMEAYVALMKLGSLKAGPILRDRLAYIPEWGPAITDWNSNFMIMAGEMNTVADWIAQWGTDEQKDALAQALSVPLSRLCGASVYSHLSPEQYRDNRGDWFEWVVWRAACARRTGLIVPLQELHARLVSSTWTDAARRFILRAEAACGSQEAINAVVDQLAADEADTLASGQGPAPGGMASLDAFYVPASNTTTPKSLRVRILQKYWLRHNLYPMPSEASDTVLRFALSEWKFNDWYALFLLAGIKHPGDSDRARLMQIWDRGDPLLQLAAIDVLYVWEDSGTLLALYEVAGSDELRSEIAWALAESGSVQGAHIVEEQAVATWNATWLNCGRVFLMRTMEDTGVGDPSFADAARKAEAMNAYFRPEWEDLGEERLEALKRLCDNSTIHPGLRVALLARNYKEVALKTANYSETDWGRPLLRKAVRELLEAHPKSSVVNALATTTNSFFPITVDIPVVVNACGDSDSDEFRRALLIDLFAAGKVYNLPVIEGLLREVWPQRYTRTEGQSILFREPGDLAASLDYYCRHAIMGASARGGTVSYPTELKLKSIVEDDSLPAGYRAFLLVYWPTAPYYIQREFAEQLLQADMPDFLKEALAHRLAFDWSQV
ncbi:MAG: DUF2330 domain-containing protein [Phycisphaerales bacterium]